MDGDKFGEIKLHKYLSPYAGTKSVYILIVFATILFAIGIILCLAEWLIQPVEGVVKTTTTAGSVGFLLLWALQIRLLLLVGLHHFFVDANFLYSTWWYRRNCWSNV